MFVEHKEALEATETPAQITTFSQAMREGAKLRQKCTGVMFRNNGSCAIGAAYEALFGYPGDSDDYGLMSQMQSKLGKRVALPCHPSLLARVIGRYKNDAGWSREQIADWLEAQGF